MAYDWTRLCEITTLTTSAATYYTHNDAYSSKSYVKLIVLHNTSAIDVVVQLWLVPDDVYGSAGTAADANQFFKQAIPAGRTVDINFEQPGLIMIDDNETIQAMAEYADVITMQIMGATE
ncbi:MAG: hypothetical protein WC495_07370 [Patescibacteria group bacterium]|jgi:hypothetical protein